MFTTQNFRIGIELEVSAKKRNLDFSKRRIVFNEYMGKSAGTKLFKVVRDGSVLNGLELVLKTPHTLKSIFIKKKTWESYLKKIAHVTTVNSSCGMHVHVSGLSKRGLMNLFKVVYKNAEFFAKVSGRVAPTYYKRADGTAILIPRYQTGYAQFVDTGSTLTSLIQGALIGENMKYYALAPRGKTVEFRFFSGTVSYKEFMTRMCLIRAILEYAEKDEEKVNFFDYLKIYKRYKSAADYCSYYLNKYPFSVLGPPPKIYL